MGNNNPPNHSELNTSFITYLCSVKNVQIKKTMRLKVGMHVDRLKLK